MFLVPTINIHSECNQDAAVEAWKDQVLLLLISGVGSGGGTVSGTVAAFARRISAMSVDGKLPRRATEEPTVQHALTLIRQGALRRWGRSSPVDG